MEEDPRWRTWLGAAQEGDRRAYAALLAASLPWLRKRARARWPRAQPADIEDIVQDTLLNLHRNLHLFDPARPAAPFLYGIMKLRGADLLRRRQRHAAREAALDDLPVTSPALATNADQDRTLDRRAMRAALRTVSPRDREIIEMVKLREMSLQEAASRTGSNVGALKVATFRAIRRLRRAMGVDDAE